MSTLDVARYGSCTLDQDGCTTCGNVAVPVRVVSALGSEALVEDRLGQQAKVAADLIPNLRAGDALLVHMGVAIHKLSTLRAGGQDPEES